MGAATGAPRRRPSPAPVVAALACAVAGAGYVATARRRGAVATTAALAATRAATRAAAADDASAAPLTRADVAKRAPSETRPHVVFVMLDDVGFNDVGYASSDLPGVTPFISKV